MWQRTREAVTTWLSAARLRCHLQNQGCTRSEIAKFAQTLQSRPGPYGLEYALVEKTKEIFTLPPAVQSGLEQTKYDEGQEEEESAEAEVVASSPRQ